MIETLPTPVPIAPHRTRAPRLGFAGAGWIGRNRLEAIARNVPVEIAAIADPSEEVCDKIARAFPQAVCARDFEALLAPEIDAIVIATPSALHAEQAITAFEHGKAVFCQKPLARTATETDVVIAAARRADRLLGVDLSYRFTAGMTEIRELVRRGTLGDICAIEAEFHNAYGPDKAWFYDAKSSGGGCLLDLGIHLVDLALWCLDFPRVESARGLLRNQSQAGFAPSSGIEDYASGQLELAGGAVMQLACSWRAPAGCNARIGLTFFGTRGGASFRNVDGSFYDFTAEHFLPDRSRRLLAGPPDAWSGRAAIDWARRLMTSPRFDPAIEHARDVATTLDRLYGRDA
jgi:predicted dehydrogenase